MHAVAAPLASTTDASEPSTPSLPRQLYTPIVPMPSSLLTDGANDSTGPASVAETDEIVGTGLMTVSWLSSAVSSAGCGFIRTAAEDGSLDGVYA